MGSPFSSWMASWFDPQDGDLRQLRHGQLMHVIKTGRSALVSSLGTVFAVGAIAAQWHDLERVIAFVATGTVLSVIAHILFQKAEALSADVAQYRTCNAYYVAHSFFVVAAMAAVGMVWIPGELAPNVFVLLVLVVCATVRAAHQGAHLPSASFSILYFAVGIGLCLSEGTMLHALMVVLGIVVALMLADLNWRMCRTVEAMLMLSQSEGALLAEQKRLVAELREANEAKSQFMARMSHELRTPLNAVIGFSDVMLQQSLGPVGEPVYLDYLKHIHSSGSHLLQLINDILDFSKMEAGRYELREGTVDAWETIDDACAMVRLRADEGGVTLFNEVPRDCLLLADELAVRQIAINLASNAVKFTPPGGTVHWRGSLDASGAFVLRVEDTGFGIPAEDLEAIFEPFGQSVSGYHARERGTGLGLPIVRSLMTLHGGSASIESELGRGTTVTLVFPPSRVQASTIRSAA